MGIRVDTNSILKEVRANLAKLRSCDKHEFQGDAKKLLEDKTAFLGNVEVTCSNCGGNMKIADVVTYAKGYKAAGGDPEDILTNVSGVLAALS